MGWLSFLFSSARKGKAAPDILAPSEGFAPVSQDTQAAITELSRAVKDNPDLVEIYLALGNLYRSHGEIERAVQIRHNLIVRPGLDAGIKAKAWYELGRDYRRGGFVDRALNAFEEAGALYGDNEEILRQVALLAAESGDFERAARSYQKLGSPVPQAHYLVRLAQEAQAKEDASAARKWLGKALKVNPGSVEAWLFKLANEVRGGRWMDVAKVLREAMDNVPQELGFLFLEGLLDGMDKMERPEGSDPHPGAGLCDAVLPVLEARTPDMLLECYGAWLLLKCDRGEDARLWLEKALVLGPDFWTPKLELLALSMDDQPLSPVFRNQLEYFISRARLVKRFFCRVCGLKRDQTFFVCPRCQSWHSIAFRTNLHD